MPPTFRSHSRDATRRSSGDEAAEPLADGTGRLLGNRMTAEGPPRDAGGSRTHLDRVAAGRLAVWLQRHCHVLARSRTWSTTSAKSRANPSPSEDVGFPRLGVDPRLAAPKAAVPSATLAGSALARSRTWSTTSGGSRAESVTLRGPDRRPESRGARIRTPSVRVGA